MTETVSASQYAIGYLDEIKKGYLKSKKYCDLFLQDHHAFCLRIGLDLDAFNIEVHPTHPVEGIFQTIHLSEHDEQMLNEYLANREKMYVLEQCVRSITDEDTRRIAELYYIGRKTQPEIAAEIGHTKSFVSKRLDSAEKGEMAASIDHYLEWKYSVPGGKNCSWAGEWERKYMKNQDEAHGILRLPDLPEMPWVKTLRRMGF